MISKPLVYNTLDINIDTNNIKKLLILNDKYTGKNKYRENTHIVHKDTSSVFLVMDKDPHSMKCNKLNIYNEFFDNTNNLVGQLSSVFGYPNIVITKCIVVTLKPYSEVKIHKDNGISFENTHRVHYALQTNKEVSFIVKNEKVPFMDFPCIEINNLEEHYVVNNSSKDRIHIIIDFYDASSI